MACTGRSVFPPDSVSSYVVALAGLFANGRRALRFCCARLAAAAAGFPELAQRAVSHAPAGVQGLSPPRGLLLSSAARRDAVGVTAAHSAPRLLLRGSCPS
jgi:hypothetical protein